MGSFHAFVILALVGISVAFTSEFIPKSFFVIDSEGRKSEVVLFREKRSLQEPLLPLVRMKRTPASYSSSSSYASTNSGDDTGIPANILFGNTFGTGLPTPGFPGFPNNLPIPFPAGLGVPQNFAGSSSSSSTQNADQNGSNILNRFAGQLDTPGISVSGSAEGVKGVYSSSSTSIDKDGKVTYNMQSGKF